MRFSSKEKQALMLALYCGIEWESSLIEGGYLNEVPEETEIQKCRDLIERYEKLRIKIGKTQ